MSDKFEQWYVDNKDRLHLTDRIAARNVWNAALSSLQGEAVGYVESQITPLNVMDVDGNLVIR